MEQHIQKWKAEEEIAYIHGWDFSHIEGRCVEEPLPWDYQEVVKSYLKPDMELLDIDTGGGEVLLSFGHPYEHTAATENYPPNVELCKQTLLPLGIDFKQADGKGKLPFADGRFHMVINRHGDFDPAELYRVLKPGGIFVNQQVGAENDREFVELLCGKQPLPFPEQYASKTAEAFKNRGFQILRQEECFAPMRFYDVGALVWFARIIPWEFPGFSVDTHLDNLLEAQKFLEQTGYIEGKAHRFLLVAQKMKDVKITAVRKVCHGDLMAKYENPIEHACDVQEGAVWISHKGEKPEGLCDSAWDSMAWFVKELARGGGNFYDGWMKNPNSAMISCNDGFRPVSFYLETVEE